MTQFILHMKHNHLFDVSDQYMPGWKLEDRLKEIKASKPIYEQAKRIRLIKSFKPSSEFWKHITEALDFTGNPSQEECKAHLHIAHQLYCNCDWTPEKGINFSTP